MTIDADGGVVGGVGERRVAQTDPYATRVLPFVLGHVGRSDHVVILDGDTTTASATIRVVDVHVRLKTIALRQRLQADVPTYRYRISISRFHERTWTGIHYTLDR